MAAVSSCNTEGDRSSGNELPGSQPCLDLHQPDSMGEAGSSPQGSSGQDQPSGSQGPLVCTACGQSFFSEKEASEHILRVHYNVEQQPSTSRQAAPAIPLGEAIRAPLASPPRRRAPTPDDTLQKIAADQQQVVEAIEGLQAAVLTTAREAAAQREREMKALLEEQQRTTAALNRLAAAAERLIDVVAAMAQTTPGQVAAQEDPE